MQNPSDESTSAPHDVDYSTPEMQEALRSLQPLILEIREELATPADRRLALYERTLGLAVIPVLIRRAFIRGYRKITKRGQS